MAAHDDAAMQENPERMLGSHGSRLPTTDEAATVKPLSTCSFLRTNSAVEARMRAARCSDSPFPSNACDAGLQVTV
jgi:hypothetical protein